MVAARATNSRFNLDLCYPHPMGEVYFEFAQLGRQMRVAAIDADSGVEVVVITPVSATKLQMQQVALAKLRKKLSEAPPTGQRLF